MCVRERVCVVCGGCVWVVCVRCVCVRESVRVYVYESVWGCVWRERGRGVCERERERGACL